MIGLGVPELLILLVLGTGAGLAWVMIARGAPGGAPNRTTTPASDP